MEINQVKDRPLAEHFNVEGFQCMKRHQMKSLENRKNIEEEERNKEDKSGDKEGENERGGKFDLKTSAF